MCRVIVVNGKCRAKRRANTYKQSMQSSHHLRYDLQDNLHTGRNWQTA